MAGVAPTPCVAGLLWSRHKQHVVLTLEPSKRNERAGPRRRSGVQILADMVQRWTEAVERSPSDADADVKVDEDLLLHVAALRRCTCGPKPMNARAVLLKPYAVPPRHPWVAQMCGTSDSGK